MVHQAISLVPNSSPGPDGIPFLAYKVLEKFAAPVPLDACNFLKTKRTPAEGDFNRATSSYFPRKKPSWLKTPVPSR